MNSLSFSSSRHYQTKDFLTQAFSQHLQPQTAVLCQTPQEALQALQIFYQESLDNFRKHLHNRSIVYKQGGWDARLLEQELGHQVVYPYIACCIDSEGVSLAQSSAESAAKNETETHRRPVSEDIEHWEEVQWSAPSYGKACEPGLYGTTVTRPELFERYLLEQLDLLYTNHRCTFIVGKSYTSIPVPFLEEMYLQNLREEAHKDPSQMAKDSTPIAQETSASFTSEPKNPCVFASVTRTLGRVNDDIINGTQTQDDCGIRPLAPFTAERVDYSLNRLYHYCGTHTEHFQNFILLTNYQRYMKDFIHYAQDEICTKKNMYETLVGPGDAVLGPKDDWEKGAKEMSSQWSRFQMPTYHLKRKDGNGITFINIGVGPSNAKNITDHLAVLRPHCWLMLGHCAGLRHSQSLGDYVIAHGYVRDDGVLDNELPLWITINQLNY